MMASNVRPSRKDLKSATNMRFSSEYKGYSKQLQNSKTAKERVLSHDEHQVLKSQGKLKVKPSVSPPNTDVHHDQRRVAEGKILVQPNSLGNQLRQSVKGKVTEDDELVKHMSNLPVYLQRMEGGENLQDKAFNVGVLDWARLENWKYTQKSSQTSGHNNVSSTSSISLRTTIKSSTFSSAAQQGTHAHQSEQNQSFNPSQKDGFPRGAKPSSQKGLRFQDLETSPKGNLGGNRKIPRASKSSASNNADITLRKGKTRYSDQKISSEMENSSTNLSNYVKIAVSQKGKESTWDDNVKKRVEETKEFNPNRKALDRTYVVSPGSKEKLSDGSDETKKRTRKSKSSLKESRELLDENLLEASHNSLSGGFPLEDVCSDELGSDIPHSCPLPKVETKVEPIMTAHSLANSPRVEFSSDAFQTPYSNKTSNILSQGKEAEQNTLEDMNASVVENLKLLDQEMAATKSRNPSPNRRFSFSLSRSRIGRSFSLKEGSTVPQLSSPYVSVKSGPVKSEEVSCLADSNRERINGPNRARSSPLRRILDPLLRSKGSNPVHAAETVQPKESLSYISLRPIIGCESLPNEKREPSTTQALLQLIIKNGLPLFRFVVDNNINFLAASTKNLACGKDDCDENYTLYSVTEIKRKSSGWISQGSKMKSCGYAYNAVGQMKVSNSRFIDLTGQKLKSESIVRESVLSGVELTHENQASPQFMLSRELAAVVLKMPSEQQKDTDVIEKGLTECMSRDGCSVNFADNGNGNSTTVILPADVHGLPKEGAPSPLIERWKSGGLCDCGGWDVGCKLRILTKHNQNCKFRCSSNCCTNSDRFELHLQGGTQQSKPMLSLVPLNKEIYSVEFNSSVSLLQAFFVCITVLGCQKSSDISEMNSLCEAKSFPAESVVNGNGIRSNPQNIFSEKIPAKYAPNPPTSPVGRV
ncbi:hypothetical protein Pint_35280 [Pistacia integerrima]|uniref:Uncharacterized protein n=1 Tax=Pistacia integerrima TaxID=434235 RepID=A0ACC0Y3S2_9ROSI|nr:hypothetical protein Pint_35280 [Pistacia integerrima]